MSSDADACESALVRLMPAATEVKLLTQEEVAKVLRKSVRSVARLRAAGELAWLPGSPIMIPETELAAYLERRMVKRRKLEQPPVRAERTPQEKAEAMIAKMKRTGAWDGFAAAHRLGAPALHLVGSLKGHDGDMRQRGVIM